MNITSLNPISRYNGKISLGSKTYIVKKTVIEEGMTPDEIADIVSDSLMEITKKQFQAAKEKFQIENNQVQIDI